MSVKIGSARIDERGKARGGAAGDQKQTESMDYKGEVSQQDFYLHSKGWMVQRAKKDKDAAAIRDNMITACNNPNIGYNQDDRYGVIKYGIHTKKKTNSDCSSLVRECVREAAGIDPGDFSTATEVSALDRTGLFEKPREYVSGMELYDGDILTTKTKGHTVIVTSGKARGRSTEPVRKSVSEVAREVIDGKWGNGTDRRNRLAAAGYSYAEVQTAVAVILNQPAGRKSLDVIVREVIDGKWGNGQERTRKLSAAGYDPEEVQKEVNKMLKK